MLTEGVEQQELTPAELTALRMIVGRMSNAEIAFAMEVREDTVDAHVREILAKLGVTDRVSAAALAVRRGIVDTEL